MAYGLMGFSDAYFGVYQLRSEALGLRLAAALHRSVVGAAPNVHI